MTEFKEIDSADIKDILSINKFYEIKTYSV